MAELGTLRQMRPTQCQLPVSWYFDPKIFELEQKHLFDVGSNYVGHELMVPNEGHYQVLALKNDAPFNCKLTGHDTPGQEKRHRQGGKMNPLLQKGGQPGEGFTPLPPRRN